MSEDHNHSHHDSQAGKKNIDRWGQLGYLTPAQQEALEAFKREVPKEHIDIAKYTVESVDQICLRFLRARQFDLNKAIALIAECHKRKTEGKAKIYSAMKVDECAQCDVSVLRKFYPHTQRGYDKMNRPLLFERNGKTDVNPIFLLTTRETLFAYHFWTMEYALDQMFTESAIKFYGATRENLTPTSPVNISTCAILDFNDFGLSHCSSKMMDLVKTYVALDNVAYPEMLGKMIVINAPWLAVQTWSIVKGWLDPRTQAKIEIIGPGQESIKRLHELIPIEYLPAEFGGTAPDLYYLKPHTEYVQLPRGGEISRSIDVPIGKTLFVDTYLGEGAVEVSIAIVTPAIISPQSPVSDKTVKQSIASSFFSRSSIKNTINSPTRELNTITTVIDSYDMKIIPEAGVPNRGSERLLKHYVCVGSSDTSISHKLYKITWKNPSKDFFGGVKNTFVYSLTISDTEEFPDMLMIMQSYTSLDSNININSNHHHSNSSNNSKSNNGDSNNNSQSQNLMKSNSLHSTSLNDIRTRSTTLSTTTITSTERSDGLNDISHDSESLRDRSPSSPVMVKSISSPEVSSTLTPSKTTISLNTVSPVSPLLSSSSVHHDIVNESNSGNDLKNLNNLDYSKDNSTKASSTMTTTTDEDNASTRSS